jgi:hypothetical protein
MTDETDVPRDPGGEDAPKGLELRANSEADEPESGDHDTSRLDSGFGGPAVFISYRLDPDQPTANSLKRLVEGSIDPTPIVFVSGAGGLRPSNIGLRPQLQVAVTSARVFLAVITPESREREWIIFEAGAAWGRNQMYAPVLIDTEPHELGTTIADFVATRADRREQMELLVVEVAKALGSTVRKHFGQRYGAFERYLEQRSRKPASNKLGTNAGSKLDHALMLWQSGAKQDALEAFAFAEVEAATIDEKARVEILRLNVLHDNDPDRFRAALLHMKQEDRETAVWRLWKGITERREHIALTDYKTVMEIPGASVSDVDSAAVFRALGLASLGRDGEALDLLMDCITKVPPGRRLQFVRHMLAHNSSLSATAKLMLAAVALSYADGDHWNVLADLALDEQWGPIAVYAARRFRGKAETGTALNTLGRAYLITDCPSLAYEAFSDASAAGISVAKVNLAVCLMHHQVPAAALKVLKAHVGEYDVAQPQFPHKVRAEIEEAIGKEQARSTSMAETGRITLNMLAELAEIGLATASAGPATMSADYEGKSVRLSLLHPFRSLYEASASGSFFGVFAKSAADDTALRGIRFDPTEDVPACWESLFVPTVAAKGDSKGDELGTTPSN